VLEKIEHIILLFDFYGPLLTEKQQRAINLHYENDFSFSEIAQHLHISRQAVYDLLKRAVTLLEEYEARLHLVEKFSRTQQELKSVYMLLNKGEELDRRDIAQAVNIIRTTLESD
jgi:predicted DNA-binding protein YlxM (UPF0122 family)